MMLLKCDKRLMRIIKLGRYAANDRQLCGICSFTTEIVALNVVAMLNNEQPLNLIARFVMESDRFKGLLCNNLSSVSHYISVAKQSSRYFVGRKCHTLWAGPKNGSSLGHLK